MRHPEYSGTPTNFIAGPLYVRYSTYYRDVQCTSKSLAACHRDGLCCCQTHAFLPTRTLPVRQLIGAREQQDHGDLYPRNHQGFRRYKESAWHIGFLINCSIFEIVVYLLYEWMNATNNSTTHKSEINATMAFTQSLGATIHSNEN